MRHSALLAQCCGEDNLSLLGRWTSPGKHYAPNLSASKPEKQKTSCILLSSTFDVRSSTRQSESGTAVTAWDYMGEEDCPLPKH